MKTTPWNPWDHIVTVEEAKDYVEAIYEEWDKESEAANDCLEAVLESYMEFVGYMGTVVGCVEKGVLPSAILEKARELIKDRKAKWEPVLKDVKKMQKAQKSGKKSA